MYKVLVVCTGNICRSPMASGLLRHSLPDVLAEQVAVTSAGIHALVGSPAQPHAVEAMAEIGIDIQNHRARQISRNAVRGADLILTMEQSQTKSLKRLTKWRQDPPRIITEFNSSTPIHDVKDPYGGTLESYQNCIRTLRPCIKGVVLWLGTYL